MRIWFSLKLARGEAQGTASPGFVWRSIRSLNLRDALWYNYAVPELGVGEKDAR